MGIEATASRESEYDLLQSLTVNLNSLFVDFKLSAEDIEITVTPKSKSLEIKYPYPVPEELISKIKQLSLLYDSFTFRINNEPFMLIDVNYQYPIKSGTVLKFNGEDVVPPAVMTAYNRFVRNLKDEDLLYYLAEPSQSGSLAIYVADAEFKTSTFDRLIEISAVSGVSVVYNENTRRIEFSLMLH